MAKSQKSCRRLRWKRLSRSGGAYRSGPRGSKLHDGKKTYAWTSALGGGWDGVVRGWFFVCPVDSVGEFANTSDNPRKSEALAKQDAMEFVTSRLRDFED